MMKKRTKTLLIISVILIVVGAVVGGAGYVMGGSTSIGIDSHGIYIPNHVRTEVSDEPLEDFTSIVSYVNYNQIKFVESDKNSFDMVYYDPKNPPKISVTNGVLEISTKGNDKDHFLSFGPTVKEDQKSITIYYKKGTQMNSMDMEFNYCDIDLGNLSCSTKATIEADYSTLSADGLNLPIADIESMYTEFYLKNITANMINVTSSYGDLTLDGFEANSFIFEGGYSNLWFNDVKVTNGSSFDLSYGELTLTGELLGTTSFESSYSEYTINLAGTDYSYDMKEQYSDVYVNGKDIVGDTINNAEKSENSSKNNITMNLSYDDMVLQYK